MSWVIEEMRKGGLKPNGATFGLAMEVNISYETGLHTMFNCVFHIFCSFNYHFF